MAGSMAGSSEVMAPIAETVVIVLVMAGSRNDAVECSMKRQ